jgi:hypothetical protein
MNKVISRTIKSKLIVPYLPRYILLFSVTQDSLILYIYIYIYIQDYSPLIEESAHYIYFLYVCSQSTYISLNSGQHPERIKRFSIETYGKSRFG